MEAVKGPDSREARIEHMVTLYQLPLLRLCVMYLHDREQAKDAVQETFLKAYRNLDSFRGDASEKTWLTRIAVNTCKDLLKSAWTRNTDRSVTPDTLPEGSTGFDEQDDTVTRAVMSLPPGLKEAVLLHWYQGLTLEEMAKVLRLPRSTINYRLKKAKMILKQELEDWYFEDE